MSVLLNFGYHKSDGVLDESKMYMSLLSIPLSPLIGILRMITMIGYLRSEPRKDPHWEKERIEYITCGLIRAGLEILCLGPVFGLIIDPLVAIHRACSQEMEAEPFSAD